MQKSLQLKAPAKLNLFLEVTGKRPDGFHALESVFQTISLYDDITISLRDSERVDFSCRPESLQTPDNLAVKAAEAFFTATGLQAGVHISLEKGIPAQAGLGGGSSDAAAVLKGLNDLFDRPLDKSALLTLGASLGSDVPFFICGGTALVTGRGEFVEPVKADTPFDFLVFFPGFGVSTAEVYKNLRLNLTEKRNSAKVLLALLASGSLEAAGEHFFNRLEQAAFALDSRLVEAKTVMQNSVGDAGVMLCGSGASLFSAFADHDRAHEAYRILRGRGMGVAFLAQSIRETGSAWGGKGDSRGDF